MKLTVAVVGVGRMGANMARRLKDAGYEVRGIYDLDFFRAQELAREIGAQACGNLEELSATAELILTVVSDDAAMESIFAESGDTLLARAAGKLFVNCATLKPETHVLIEARAKAVGAESLEACMASSITQAREGTLYLMVAGERETYQKALPVLETLSSSLKYIGATGQAAKVKALVNMVMNINTAGLAEGLGLAKALGLDLELVVEVFSQTGASSRVLVTDGPDMISREHDCYFSAEHAAKDSGIANTLGQLCGLDLPLSRATERQYRRLIDLGLGEWDKSAIAELTFPGRAVHPDSQ